MAYTLCSMLGHTALGACLLLPATLARANSGGGFIHQHKARGVRILLGSLNWCSSHSGPWQWYTVGGALPFQAFARSAVEWNALPGWECLGLVGGEGCPGSGVCYSAIDPAVHPRIGLRA